MSENTTIAPEGQADAPYRVAEFWSSSTPGKKVRMLAEGADIVKWSKRGDFIGWVDRAAPAKAWSGELPELPWDDSEKCRSLKVEMTVGALSDAVREYASSSVGAALEEVENIVLQQCMGMAAKDLRLTRILDAIRALNKLAPAGAGAAQVGARELPPAEQITDAESARVFLTAWHNEHFPTDRTFHRYIMGRDKHRALAGDFAWQLAKALVAISAPGMPPQSAPTESVMRAHDWNRSMIGVKALLSCTEGELECIGEKLLDTYIEEVNAVYSAMSAYVIPTPAAPQSAVAVAQPIDERAEFEKMAERHGFDLTRTGASDGAYYYSATRAGWLSWQVSAKIERAVPGVLEAAAPTDAAPWQPIETAPKDGTLILLGRAADEANDRGEISTPGRWHEEDHDGPDNMGHDAGFMDDEFQQFAWGRSFGNSAYKNGGFQPTHWMPLPPAPDAGQQGTEGPRDA